MSVVSWDLETIVKDKKNNHRACKEIDVTQAIAIEGIYQIPKLECLYKMVLSWTFTAKIVSLYDYENK